MEIDTVRPSARFDATEATPRRVLVVEDEPALARVLCRILVGAGFDVELASDGAHAAERLVHESFGVVVSDINLPGTSGVDLLRTIRAYDLDLPVILVTGNPCVETAAAAVELGAMLYLTKPVPTEQLLRAVTRAIDLNGVALAKRTAMKLAGAHASVAPGDLAGLSTRFDSMLESLWVAFQPIVDLRKNIVLGYEALLRSREPSLPTPLDVIQAAERLGKMAALGHRVRSRALRSFEGLNDKKALLFLNLHTTELLDATLYSPSSQLSSLAERIVLEVTERCAMDAVQDVKARANALRLQGFRLAIDDLGAGYAGLTSFLSLEPEFVKLDMSLIRAIDSSKMRQHIVRSVVDLCARLGMKVVAEGIETSAELRIVRLLGCDAAQGFYIGKPRQTFAPMDALRA